MLTERQAELLRLCERNWRAMSRMYSYQCDLAWDMHKASPQLLRVDQSRIGSYCLITTAGRAALAEFDAAKQREGG